MTDKVFFPTAFHRDCTLHSATSGLNRIKQNARKHYDNSEQIEFLCSLKNCWWPNKVSSWNLTWFISRLIWCAPGRQYAQQDNLLWSTKVRILQLPAQISLKGVAQYVDPSLCLPPPLIEPSSLRRLDETSTRPGSTQVRNRWHFSELAPNVGARHGYSEAAGEHQRGSTRRLL